jgi:hypothetical protein
MGSQIVFSGRTDGAAQRKRAFSGQKSWLELFAMRVLLGISRAASEAERGQCADFCRMFEAT